jgi:hypothetical protein
MVVAFFPDGNGHRLYGGEKELNKIHGIDGGGQDRKAILGRETFLP